MADAGQELCRRLEIRGRKKSHRMTVESDLRNHIAPFFASKELDKIEPRDIERYISAKLKVLAPKTVRNHLNTMHSVFEIGQRMGWCERNPVKLADRPVIKTTETRIKFLDQAELEKLLALPYPDDAFGSIEPTLYLTAAMTGLRQSGSEPARHGRISKAGASEARHMLGEAAWSVAKTAGPMRAFFDRVEARRGPQVAATATARKLCALFWQLLTRDEDYAFARPMMTRHKLRELELRAGARPQRGRQHAGGPLRSQTIRKAEQAASDQAEFAYRRFITDWKSANPERKPGAGATQERASIRPSKRQAARQASAPKPAL